MPDDELIGGLTAAWARTWATGPDSLALVAPAEGIRWRSVEFADRTAAAAGALHGLGVRPRDRVLLSCAPSAATVVAHVAVLRLGATVVPVNPAATDSELAHVLAVAWPTAAVLDDPSRPTGVPTVTPGALLAGPRRSPEVALDAAAADDTAMLGFTSGTTGRPKAAVLSHANLLAGARSVVRAWEWVPDDRLVLALPLFHMHGLGVGVHGSLTAGAAMVVLPRFDAGAVAEAAGRERATLFFGVPTMYARLAESGRLGDLAALRLLVSGSAPLTEPLFEAVRSGAGQPPLERYGMTETVMLTGNPLHGERRAGSVGLPLPGVEVRLALGSGEVEVRGPNVFAGYLDRPEDTRAAFTADGWFRTGDVGRWDDDGYLRLVGRARDLIITGGFNVYPREVEDVLGSCPGVRDIAVVGRPDPVWGEVVVAVVVVDGPQVLADLEARAVQALSPYKRPREWRVVEELPRNAMGKVERTKLV